jgi:hypothetical protein
LELKFSFFRFANDGRHFPSRLGSLREKEKTGQDSARCRRPGKFLCNEISVVVRQTLSALDVSADVHCNTEEKTIIIDADKAYVKVWLLGTLENPKFSTAAAKCWKRGQPVQSPPIRLITTGYGEICAPLGWSRNEMALRLKYLAHRWVVWFVGLRDQAKNIPLPRLRRFSNNDHPICAHNKSISKLPAPETHQRSNKTPN